MKTIIKILICSDGIDARAVPEKIGRVNIEPAILDELSLTEETGTAYKALPEILERIKKLTSNHEADYVLVGNNIGAGVAKAAAIAPEMRKKTIIMWNEYEPGDEKPYAEMGFENFASRRDAESMLIRKIMEDLSY